MGFPIINTENVSIKQCKHGDFAYLKSDTIIGKSLDTYGEYAESELALASQLLRPGFKVVDVGANVGLHSVFYSKLIGKEGEVYAFEPSHLNYFFLVTNLTINNAFNVQHFKAAIGTQKPLYLPINKLDDKMNHGALKTSVKDGGDDFEQCAVFQLDDIGLDYCNLVKVDVEGNEIDVLQTGEKLFSQQRPFIMCEAQENTKELFQFVKDIGYEAYWVPVNNFNPDNFFESKECIFDDPTSQVINIFAYPKEIDIDITNLKKVKGVNDKWKTLKKTTKKKAKKKAKKKPSKTKSSSKP
jgi:FkbM family methyltransferase